ncbi:acetylornithine transaminase [Paenibacillus sp. J22TS3]|uniref:acetylornithine transaminase n=1 Tax=Paenibacillus sp. J22TS3 TaxID=2807192 RepID=UPI001B18C6C6|nr:acetylornithine transaminase [Paenibacillus sp. J22TS3]GIP21732.1 acetylornithine aminotransferase [Paenibacillus sp. J22TS3]
MANSNVQAQGQLQKEGKEQGGSVSSGTASALFPTYGRFPISLVKGEGSWAWDDQGNRYLDFYSGIAVNNLGHAPEKVKNRIKEQLDQIWHVSNLFEIPQQEQAAQLLASLGCGDAVFFGNSGAEANEAAIKLARRYHQKIKGEQRYEIITFKQSFHGRTLATLTATGQDKVKEGFLPLPEGFVTVEMHDIEALKAAIGPKTAAIMLEMVRAEGGIHLVAPAFLQEVEALRKEHGILLIVDEVQTGMGRTGKWFAHQHYGIEPDIFTLAKGIGSGIPAGAMLAKEYLREAFSAGSHASTFGGNPIASTAIIATIEAMQEDQLPERAAEMGDYLINRLQEKLGGHPFVREVRGKGLIVGIECDGPVADLVTEGQKNRLLFITAGPNVIRLLPNLYVTQDEIDQAVDILSQIIARHEQAKEE